MCCRGGAGQSRRWDPGLEPPSSPVGRRRGARRPQPVCRWHRARSAGPGKGGASPLRPHHCSDSPSHLDVQQRSIVNSVLVETQFTNNKKVRKLSLQVDTFGTPTNIV